MTINIEFDTLIPKHYPIHRTPYKTKEDAYNACIYYLQELIGELKLEIL